MLHHGHKGHRILKALPELEKKPSRKETTSIFGWSQLYTLPMDKHDLSCRVATLPIKKVLQHRNKGIQQCCIRQWCSLVFKPAPLP